MTCILKNYKNPTQPISISLNQNHCSPATGAAEEIAQLLLAEIFYCINLQGKKFTIKTDYFKKYATHEKNHRFIDRLCLCAGTSCCPKHWSQHRNATSLPGCKWRLGFAHGNYQFAQRNQCRCKHNHKPKICLQGYKQCSVGSHYQRRHRWRGWPHNNIN